MASSIPASASVHSECGSLPLLPLLAGHAAETNGRRRVHAARLMATAVPAMVREVQVSRAP